MKENLIHQLLSNASTFSLGSIVLILAFSKKFNVNLLLVIACSLALLNAIASLIFWSNVPTNRDIATFGLITNVLFSSVSAMFFYGVIEMIIEKNPNSDQQQSVLGMLLLSLITMGFYIPYWYIKRKGFYKIRSFPLVLYIFLFVPAVWLRAYQSPNELAISKFTWVVEVFMSITAIFLAFNFRWHMLNKNDEFEISPFLTFLFGPFYLQYKLNQVEEEPAQG